MKSRVLLVVAACMVDSLVLSAQSVDFVVASRREYFLQSAAGAAAHDGADPYGIVVGVKGQNLDAPAFTFGFRKPDDGVTIFPGFVQAAGLEWLAPDPPSSGRFSSMSLLDAAFPGGTYTILTSAGNTTLTVSNGAYFSNAPYVIATQDGSPVTWSGGVMTVDPTRELTLTNGPWTFNNGAGVKPIILRVAGNALDLEMTNENPAGSFLFSGLSVQLQIPAHTLSAGSVYAGTLEYTRVLNSGYVDLSATFGAGAIGAVDYTAHTAFTIQAIPEPSTYAAMFGALACLGVAYKRRRALVGVMIHHRHRMRNT